MNNLRTTVAIIVAVAAIAIIVASATALIDNDGKTNVNDDDSFYATFNQYINPDHPSTVAKYMYNGNDVTGTTVLIDRDNVIVNVTVTSSEPIYGMTLNSISSFDDKSNIAGESSPYELVGQSTYTMNAKLFSSGGDIDVVATPYYSSNTNDYTYSIYTQIGVSESLTCYIGGKQVMDRDYVQTELVNANTIDFDVKATHTVARIFYQGNWENMDSHERYSYKGMDSQVSEFAFNIEFPMLFLPTFITGSIQIACHNNIVEASDVEGSSYATFNQYIDPDHPSTVAKYEYHGNDVTGQTLLIDEDDADVKVTVTSEESIYGMCVNSIPIFDDELGATGVSSPVEGFGQSTYTMDATLFFFGGDINVVVTPYYSSNTNDGPSGITYTTISLSKNLVCHLGEKEIKNGDVIQVSSDNMHIMLNVKTATLTNAYLVAAGYWDNGYSTIEHGKYFIAGDFYVTFDRSYDDIKGVWAFITYT